MYNLSDYDYTLPEAFIAQFPEEDREKSRLLKLDRRTGTMEHHIFHDIADLFSRDDLLVVNNTKVVPGRLLGQKETGGKIEALILDYPDGKQEVKDENAIDCTCLVKASKRPGVGTVLLFDEGLTGEVTGYKDNACSVRFEFRGDFDSILYKIGKAPLPPYIKRENNHLPCHDREKYQTVYAEKKGAIAAPTAGLHFSKDLLDKLEKNGVSIVEITLHVGYGTFLPVRSNDIRRHNMHSEHFTVPEKTAEVVNTARKQGRRIVAVGTTSVRTLEYASDKDGNLLSGKGSCDLFIYPGYEYKVVDALITNFHLPKSTLLMLVSAFAGREKVLAAYQEAVREGYRFYSYGDAMLIV